MQFVLRRDFFMSELKTLEQHYKIFVIKELIIN